MLNKFLTIILVTLLACAAICAQQPATPAAPTGPKPPDRSVMIFGHDDGGYLGIQAASITSENLSQFGLKEVRGVGIEKVIENSPAAAAGLQNGDVILRFDGEEVKSMAKLTRLIGETAPDQKARLTILRGGEEREITVTLGKRPAMSFGMERFGTFPAMPSMPAMPNMPPMPNMPTPDMKLSDEYFKALPAIPGQGVYSWAFIPGRKIGVVAEPLTKQLGEHFGVADGKGLLIMEVRENSPAARAGIKAGDIIVEVDGAAVSEAVELIRAVNAKKEGDVEITFVRDRNRQKVRVTPEQTKETDLPAMFEAKPGSTVTTPRAPRAPGAVRAVPMQQTVPVPPAAPMPVIRAVRII